MRTWLRRAAKSSLLLVKRSRLLPAHGMSTAAWFCIPGLEDQTMKKNHPIGRTPFWRATSMLNWLRGTEVAGRSGSSQRIQIQIQYILSIYTYIYIYMYATIVEPRLKNTYAMDFQA